LGRQITLKGVYYIARCVLEAAYEKDLIYRMPKIKLPKIEERAPHLLNAEQIPFLLNVSKTSKYGFGLWLELGTGFRRGSMLALDCDDFDFDDNTVEVNKRMVREGGKIVSKPGAKTKAGTRIYDVPPIIMKIIGEINRPGHPLFETENGTRLSLWNWSRLFRSWRTHADSAIEVENGKRLKLFEENENEDKKPPRLIKKMAILVFTTCVTNLHPICKTSASISSPFRIWADGAIWTWRIVQPQLQRSYEGGCQQS